MKDETILGFSTTEKIITIILFPILGAIFGWFIPTIAEWIVKIPFPYIPLEGLFVLVAGLKSGWVSVITALIGMIAGLIFVYFVFRESLEITITDKEVKLNVEEKENVIQKNEISSIYMEGKELVFLGIEGNELFRGHPDLKQEKVSKAFTQHMYPWKDKNHYYN